MKTLLTLLMLLPIVANSQINDSDIAKDLLGKKIYEINAILDSLDIWHYMHSPEKVSSGTKIISIETREGATKVYTLRLGSDGQTIKTVIINFRHDNKKHVEDAKSITGQTSHHVGRYSTDLVFEL